MRKNATPFKDLINKGANERKREKQGRGMNLYE
jgi:hypothetical protein